MIDTLLGVQSFRLQIEILFSFSSNSFFCFVNFRSNFENLFSQLDMLHERNGVEIGRGKRRNACENGFTTTGQHSRDIPKHIEKLYRYVRIWKSFKKSKLIHSFQSGFLKLSVYAYCSDS